MKCTTVIEKAERIPIDAYISSFFQMIEWDTYIINHPEFPQLIQDYQTALDEWYHSENEGYNFIDSDDELEDEALHELEEIERKQYFNELALRNESLKEEEEPIGETTPLDQSSTLFFSPSVQESMKIFSQHAITA